MSPDLILLLGSLLSSKMASKTQPELNVPRVLHNCEKAMLVITFRIGIWTVVRQSSLEPSLLLHKVLKPQKKAGLGESQQVLVTAWPEVLRKVIINYLV